MSSELHVKHVPPVPEYFSITCNRSAAFDMIVTLKWALAEGENLPESLGEILEALTDQYGDADWPTGIPALEVPDTVDGDAAAA